MTSHCIQKLYNYFFGKIFDLIFDMFPEFLQRPLEYLRLRDRHWQHSWCYGRRIWSKYFQNIITLFLFKITIYHITQFYTDISTTHLEGIDKLTIVNAICTFVHKSILNELHWFIDNCNHFLPHFVFVLLKLCFIQGKSNPNDKRKGKDIFYLENYMVRSVLDS